MKIYYLNIFIVFILLITSVLGCDVSSSNSNYLSENTDLPIEEDWRESATKRGFLNLSNGIIGSRGVTMQILADQVTSTNNVRDFYSAAQEPRLPLSNLEGQSMHSNIEEPFRSFTSYHISYTANNIIEFYKEDSKYLAQAYLMRGIANGYLGLIYDKVPTADYNDEWPPLVNYSSLIDSALADLDRAIELSKRPINGIIPTDVRYDDFEFKFDGFPGANPQWNHNYLRRVANSFAARILAGKARTYEEALHIDWARVLNYAEKGLLLRDGNDTFALSNIGSSGEFANYLVDWSTFIISGIPFQGDIDTGAGYLPVDFKVIHLLDENYPTEYPAEAIQEDVLTFPEATSSDPRLNNYYKYTQNKGFLREDRNTSLFSNYLNKRMYADNDWWMAENKVILFTESEIQYLEAEAHIMLGNFSKAAQILNESPAGTGNTNFDFALPALRSGYIEQNGVSGNHFFDGSESLAEMQLALLREYSIELEGLGGTGIQWFFMRRHDLLQKGTPTMYPIPDSQLDYYGLPNYSFGGVENAGQVGTASGANSWKNLRAKIATE